ncbi:hypothetical protein X471_00279 [Bartonella bacilliformis str. Heidi Mejia]|nr:hypothetical protein X471_00279 [Bartonella bacilliformis str. Heidi Mejia]KEG18930.1 hypothetical protein H707_00668 [Bartonella bacilliformis Hosp800-02]KEG23442.1 hypothetical protein H708_00676 [Bartonella bacilliformis VAB9028]KEG24387.1 hypothetical protein H706_00678 [Bartonella bacilliformis CAR600-02]
MLSSVHSKSAFICETVAPELAALVAANFLNPCADFLCLPGYRALRNMLTKLSLMIFFAFTTDKVSSPIGPVASVAANLDKMGRKTSV